MQACQHLTSKPNFRRPESESLNRLATARAIVKCCTHGHTPERLECAAIVGGPTHLYYGIAKVVRPVNTSTPDQLLWPCCINTRTKLAKNVALWGISRDLMLVIFMVIHLTKLVK